MVTLPVGSKADINGGIFQRANHLLQQIAGKVRHVAADGQGQRVAAYWQGCLEAGQRALEARSLVGYHRIAKTFIPVAIAVGTYDNVIDLRRNPSENGFDQRASTPWQTALVDSADATSSTATQYNGRTVHARIIACRP